MSHLVTENRDRSIAAELQVANEHRAVDGPKTVSIVFGTSLPQDVCLPVPQFMLQADKESSISNLLAEREAICFIVARLHRRRDPVHRGITADFPRPPGKCQPLHTPIVPVDAQVLANKLEVAYGHCLIENICS